MKEESFWSTVKRTTMKRRIVFSSPSSTIFFLFLISYIFLPAIPSLAFIPQMDNTDIDPEILSAEYDDDNSAQIVYSNSAMGKNELPIHRYVFEVTSSTTSEDFIHIFKTWSLIDNGNSDSDIVSTNLYSYDQGMKISEESKWQKKEEEKSTRKGEGNSIRRYEFHIYFMMEKKLQSILI